MTDIVAFLNARVDEDEAEALKHPDGEDSDLERWEILATGEMHYPCSPYLRIAKARALADVEAKRQIIEALEGSLDSQALDAEDRCYECGTRPLVLLRLLALPYAAHPDYDPGWRR